jgi:hypothetical protein
MAEKVNHGFAFSLAIVLAKACVFNNIFRKQDKCLCY